FEMKSNIVSYSVALGARASALRCLEDIYEEQLSSSLVDGHRKLHVQDHIGPIVSRILEDLRHNFDSELEALRKEMEKDCQSVYSELRMSLDQDNFTVCNLLTYYSQKFPDISSSLYPEARGRC